MSRAAPEPSPPSVAERVVLLLANRENSRLLGDLLTPKYAVQYELPGSAREVGGGGIDLCIVDGVSLHRHWRDLSAARATQEPVLLPILLLTTRADVGLVTPEVWEIVDDVLPRPIAKLELRLRIESALRARRLSLKLREMSTLYAHERHIAERFQQAAMPHELPHLSGMTLSAFYRPGSDEALVGGDWYDALPLADGRLILSVGDVVGAGLEAAVAMAKVRQVVRGVAQILPDPAMMLDAADRTLQAEDPERIVTAFIGVFDPVTWLLTYASAGHPRPLMRRPEGTITELTSPSSEPPLGVLKRVERTTQTIEVPPGALLVLYTDGLTEATRDVFVGGDRLRAALSDNDVLNARNIARAIYYAVVPGQAHDDVAILAIATGVEGGHEVLRWSIDVNDAEAARRARREFLAELESRGVPFEERQGAELVFGELIGNVVRYAPPWAEIALDWNDSAPVLHVLDSGPSFRFIPKLPNLMSERGRGLFMVSSFTQEFTVTPRPHGGSHARAVLSVSSGGNKAPAGNLSVPHPTCGSELRANGDP